MKIILIISGVLFALAALGACAVSIAKKEEGLEKASQRMRRCIPLIALMSVTAFVLALSCTIIPSGKTGVLISYGQVDPQVLNNGIHFTVPFIQSVEVVNNKQQDMKPPKWQKGTAFLSSMTCQALKTGPMWIPPRTAQ